MIQFRLLSSLILLVALPGCFVINADLDVFGRKPKALQERVLSGEGDAKILLLDVTRMISDSEETGTFGIGGRESLLSRVEQELAMAEKDDDIKGVIVRINSPGGTVTASDMLYRRLMQFKADRQVPLYAQLMDVAASGGYYTALAADRIVAHPTSVTGSIGVIFFSVNFAGLMEKIGVENQTVKTGVRKDIGSPLRTMSADEKDLLEDVIGEMFDRFIHLVRVRRPAVTDAQQAIFGDGRIVSAGQAMDLGLVDELGYLDETIESMRKQIGAAQVRTIAYRRPDERLEALYTKPGTLAPTINLLNVDLGMTFQGPRFLYMWMPQGN